MKRSSLTLILMFSLLAQAFGQGQPPPQEAATNDDEVVRITTNLVQVDAVVTDKKGKLVTDLKPEEVEIFEDGRPQKITNFSFVATTTDAPATTGAPAAPPDKNAPPVPPVRLKPEQVRRTVALVVDDLGLSFESTAYVRQALRKFVDKQLQPGDLVAIIRTAGGIGALQQFTSDRRQLYAAIDRVRWYPMGRGGVGAFAPIGSEQAGARWSQVRGQGSDRAQPKDTTVGDDLDINASDNLDLFREDLFTVGTLGALSYVIRGMKELPGRKSVLLMSDGIRIFSRKDAGRSARVVDALRRLTDQANRASVVIYTMDARGLPVIGLTAADNTTDLSFQDLHDELQDRRAAFFESQSGLDYLSRTTGGFAIRNTNDLSGGIRRVLEDQKGYYLIGYRPEESTFDPATGRRKFHHITLKLKRPGLRQRTRTGFYGITDEQAVLRPRTPGEQLVSALTSPFGSADVRLRLTSLFGADPAAGAFVRSLFHIDARDLTFTEEPDGWHKAVISVLAVTYGDNGSVVDQVSTTQTLRARDESYREALENGVVFTLTVPIKKPGAYQLRVAIRDTASERVGSASQFIEVPDVKKNRLALSGVLVEGTNRPGQNASAAAGAAQAPGADPQSGPAVRKFRQGTLLSYAFVVYNARPDKATGRPQLQTQARLFRDGREVFAGRPQPFDAPAQADPKRLAISSALQLGTELPPGEYILQTIVTDALADRKHATATQWIDFEIVK